MRFLSTFFSALLFGLVAIGSLPAFAQSEGSVLFVAPHRLIIASTEKASTISVSNKSDKSRRYDLTMIDQVMTPEGVTQRKDTFEYSAKSMVNFTPRRFTLEPGQSQVVRVVVSRPADLADGDYHSHLLFREVPLSKKDKEDLKEERTQAEKTVSFEIRTLYGIAVPIIVQQGKITSDIAMGDPALEKKGKTAQLKIDFTRSGNAEAAGKVTAEYVKEGAKPVPVIEAQWVRLYRESDHVSKTFDLTDLPAGAKGGKIVVSLMKDENDPSRTVKKDVSFQ